MYIIQKKNIKPFSLTPRSIRNFSLILYFAFMLYSGNDSNIGVIISSIVIAMIIVGCFGMRIRKKTFFNYSLLSITITFIVISTLLYSDNQIRSLAKLFSQIVAFLFVISTEYTEQEKRKLSDYFLLFSTIYSILLIYDVLNNPNRYYHSHIIILGTSQDPNACATYFALAASLSLAVFLHEKKKRYIMPFTIAICAIILTSSRGGLVGASVSCLMTYILFLTKKYRSENAFGFRKILISCALAVSIIFLINYLSERFPLQWSRLTDLEAMQGGNGRINLWMKGVDKILKRPLLGYGISGFDYIQGKAVHNTFLQVTLAAGIIAGLCYMYIIISSLIKCYISKSYYSFSVLLALAVSTFFYDAFILKVLWIGLMLCFINARIVNKEEVRIENIS